MSDISSKASHKSITVDGVNMFYREAGEANRPTLLLVHGFPTSSHMYRHLLSDLADQFHVIAPDLPGFGFTEVPAERQYLYTFDALADSLRAFVDALNLERFILYIFDYGAPVGLRLARMAPHQIAGLVSQNGNTYLEGLGDAFGPVRTYWETPNKQNLDALRAILTLEATRWQYEHGVSDTSLIAPETYTLDYALLRRPGNDEIQLQLFHDYQHNLSLYPAFQAFLRQHRPRTLVIWGKNDPFFTPPGAQAFLRDVPDAQVELLDTGHFALETHGAHIADRIRSIFASD